MFIRDRSVLVGLALTTALLLSAHPLLAQTTTNDWSRVSSLESGTKLVVKLKSGKSVKGTFTNVSDSALTVDVNNSSQQLRREDVLSVHRLTKKSATAPTLIGAGVGAGAGAAVGAAGSSRDDSFDKLDHAVTAGLTVIGAGVGAITGYLIGRSGNKRELIYAAR